MGRWVPEEASSRLGEKGINPPIAGANNLCDQSENEEDNKPFFEPNSSVVHGFLKLITGIAIVHTTGMPVDYAFDLVVRLFRSKQVAIQT